MDDPIVLVGLGNPGSKYADTRHNIGFMVIDALAEKWGISLREEPKFEARMGAGTIKGKKVYLVEPTTFMNLSGRTIQKLAGFYKIPYEQFLVLYDDIDLPLGKIRFRPDGSAGSHNGMKSVLAETGNAPISRLRIGVGAPPPQWDLVDYVLAAFPESERDTLKKVIDLCMDGCDYWLRYDTPKSQNKYNSVDLLAPPKPPKKPKQPPAEAVALTSPDAPPLEEQPS